MMYNKNLAVAIKTNGKILREFKDTVYVPFGSEYSVLIKNLETRRVIVNVFIDGDNAVPGGLVIDAGREINLERWIRNGNLTEGNRFKFIERTGGIEQHRGIKLEDGLVRIEYQFEKVQPMQDWSYKRDHYGQLGNPYYGRLMNSSSSEASIFKKGSEYSWTQDKYTLDSSGSISQMNVGGALRGIDYSKGESVRGSAAAAVNQVAPSNNEYHDGAATMDWNDVGITVPGSKSEQKFSTASWFPTEADRHVMILKLLGETANNQPVVAPITVKTKPRCVTCNHQNKATSKFCNKCGTALEIFA